jgi:hypothetical protein
MDPVLARKLIEGYQNELEPQRKALEAFYRQSRCPKCTGTCQRAYVPGHAFADPDTLVPRSCLRCQTCDCLFDPHSNIVLELGDVPIR